MKLLSKTLLRGVAWSTLSLAAHAGALAMIEGSAAMSNPAVEPGVESIPTASFVALRAARPAPPEEPLPAVVHQQGEPAPPLPSPPEDAGPPAVRELPREQPADRAETAPPALPPGAAPAVAQHPDRTAAQAAPSGASHGAETPAAPSAVVNPPPRYPPAAQRRNLEGVVRLSVRVDPEGKPIQVELARSSGFALFDREARETVLRRWRFENGDAVREPFEVVISFELKE